MPCCLQVSRLQVAELVTAAVLNPELAENKCLEVVAETTAPNMALEALLEQANTEITKVGLPAGSGRHSPVVWCECGGRGGGGGSVQGKGLWERGKQDQQSNPDTSVVPSLIPS
jgi:hypothetical protein